VAVRVPAAAPTSKITTTAGVLGGRPPAFDREAYKQRNTVERCINRLKQWRGIATHRRGLCLPSRDAAMDRLLEQFEDAEWAVRNVFRDDLWGGESLRRSGHAGSTGGSGG